MHVTIHSAIYSITFVCLFILSGHAPALIAQDDCEAGAEVCFSVGGGSQTGSDNQAADESGGNDLAAVPASIDDTEVTTETYSPRQAALADGITADLKARRLTLPPGDNALQKIRELKALQPYHDYSVNGETYIANIYVSLGRVAYDRGNIERARRNLAAAQKLNANARGAATLESQLLALDDDSRATGVDQSESRDSAAVPETVIETEPATQSGEDTGNSVLPALTDQTGFFAPVMVAIPAGKFVMGSESGAEDEKPVHEVIVNAFSMSRYEITLEQYSVFAADTGAALAQFKRDDATRPVVHVSWQDAVAYAQWLGEKTGKLYRLPTEAEWEYAARAGTRTPFYTGDDISGLANCVGCGGEWDDKQTAPVGSFPSNQFGVFDMHGNVWEWVTDCWTDDYSGRGSDAAAIEMENCSRRVLRGGSWYNDSDYARSSYRANEVPDYRDEGVGFRVVHDGL